MIRIKKQTDQMKSTKKVTDSVSSEYSPNDQNKKPDQTKSTKKVTDSVRPEDSPNDQDKKPRSNEK